MAVLVCENLKYLYSVGTPFETAAIENVDFSVENGDLTLRSISAFSDSSIYGGLLTIMSKESAEGE